MPAKRAIQAIEAKSSNMALIFLELIKMAVAIKQLPNSLNSEFKKKCISVFNKRWAQFDIDIYLVTYFLHPNYRGNFNYFYFLLYILYLFYSNLLDKGFQDKTFRQVALTAMQIWSKFGGNENSCKILLNQLRLYYNHKAPYDMEYTNNYDTPELWWSTCRQPKNYIQELALKLFSITPHQASCERVFSILNWMIGKRRTR